MMACHFALSCLHQLVGCFLLLSYHLSQFFSVPVFPLFPLASQAVDVALRAPAIFLPTFRPFQLFVQPEADVCVGSVSW